MNAQHTLLVPTWRMHSQTKKNWQTVLIRWFEHLCVQRDDDLKCVL